MNYIRFATPEDAAEILQIYTPFITSTAVTFEVDVPRPYEMRRRIVNTGSVFPWLVCEIDGVIAGYAFASAHKSKPAYNWNAELAVYIRESYQRCNIASALYYALIKLLKEQGFYKVIALVTASNEKSEHFHTTFGFTKVGVLTNIGYKLNAWHSVVIYEKPLVQELSAPKTIRSVQEIDDEICSNIFQTGSKIIRVNYHSHLI